MRAAAGDPALLAVVRRSYTDAFHVAGLVAVAVMVVVIVLVDRATRATPSSTVAEPERGHIAA